MRQASYAARLVAMSRGAVPAASAAPVGGPEPAREEHVETDLPQAIASTTATTSDALPNHRPVATTATEGDIREIQSEPPSVTTEHRTTVERMREVSVPAPPAPTAHSPVDESVRVPPIAVERIVMPASAQWLAENPRAPDPLVASAETETLRELMRSVRQWTSSSPSIVEPRTPEPEVVAARPEPATAAAEPVQVSIGNVVITVEDAPAAASRGRARSPAQSSGDRLARNHIRGT